VNRALIPELGLACGECDGRTCSAWAGL